MIVKEFYEVKEDGVSFYRTYSDEDKYIRKVGTDEMLIDAVDVLDYDYEEADQVIEKPEIEEQYEVLE